jgi:hypothetical protein
MPRLSRPVIVVLIALTLLTPTLATAFPEGATIRSTSERPEATPGLFAKLWDLLSAVWATGSILEPNGASAPSESGTEPNADTGDTGSGLDPDG